MRQDTVFSAPFVAPRGCGVGLRTEHYEVITRDWPEMDWFEAITENYMDSGGRPLRILEEVRKRYPVAIHGVSLSIGSVDPLNPRYLERLKNLNDRIAPFVVSDHLCWTGVDGNQLHDLLPLPFTEEALRHIVSRVQQVQECLGRKILLENVSSYVTYKHSVIPEWEFLAETARRSGCGILLDLNNVYVNAQNHKFDPYTYLENIPGEKVGQFHLAGHTDMGDFLFDTHKGEVIAPVWGLYRKALELYGPVSTLIEWDEAIPEFSRLAQEAEKARAYYRKAEAVKRNSQKTASVSSFSTVPEISAPPLKDVQRWMKVFFQPSPEKGLAGSESLLNPQGKATGVERMGVYAEGYGIRIHEALKEAYEAVRHVIGEGRFWELAQSYASAYPSQEYNLSLAGRHFPGFLEKSSLLQEWPFLSDLAGLEWAVTEAFHSFDRPPQELSALSGLALEDWEKVSFEFQPSLRLVRSSWPVLDIWRERKTPHEKIKIDLQNRPQWIVVGRLEWKVRSESVTALEYECLDLLRSGRSLGEVCEVLAEKAGEEELPLMNWFAKWSSGGMIAGVKLAGVEISKV